MTRRRGLAVVALFVFALAVVAGPRAHALERPPALAQLDGCQLWHGLGSGNDPSMIDEVRICPEADGSFTGVMQHSSTQSGFGIRTIVGRIEGGTHYVFRDTRFIENQPASGWRFCLADAYVLDRSGTHLEGRYDSAECDDHGHITLDLVEHGDGRTGMEGGTAPAGGGGGGGGGGGSGGGSVPAPAPTPSVPAPTPAPIPAPDQPPSGSMFGC